MESRLSPLHPTTYGIWGHRTESCGLRQSSSSVGPLVRTTIRHPRSVEPSGSPGSSERDEPSSCATEGQDRARSTQGQEEGRSPSHREVTVEPSGTLETDEATIVTFAV